MPRARPLSRPLSWRQTDEKDLRDRWRQMQSQLAASRDKLGKAERVAQEQNTKLASLREATVRVRESAEDALAEKAEAEALLADLAPDTDLDARLEAAKSAAATRRHAFTNVKSQLDGLERELRSKITRLDAISQERTRWLSRGGNAETQISTLHQRLGEVRSEIDTLHELPAKIEARRQKLLNEISEADGRRKDAAIKLAEAEHAVRDQERAIREAQTALGQAREHRARIEARLEGAREKRRDQARMIRELFECSAEDVLNVVHIDAETVLPLLPEVEQSIVKLKADRERLGGVNLRAEEEAQAIGAEYREHGGRARRPRRGDRQAAPGHHQSQPRRPGAPHSKPSTPSTAISSACSTCCSAAARRNCSLSRATTRWNPGWRSCAARPARSRRC